jgi:hypothetical protein
MSMVARLSQCEYRVPQAVDLRLLLWEQARSK